MNDAEHARIARHHQRRPARSRHLLGHGGHLRAKDAPARFHVSPHGVGRTLANLVTLEIHTAHARLGRKGNYRKTGLRQLALADAEALLGEHHHTASLGRLVGQACQLSRIGKFALANAANGQKGRSLTVAERDSARFVEQEHIYITRRLDGTSAGGQHIGCIQSAHAGNADSGQQRADGGRRQAHEQRHQRGDSQRISRAVLRGGKCSEQVQGQRHRKKHQRQRDEQQLESLLVGGLFARG